MKNIGKYPIEVFCYDYEDNSDSCISARKQQYCKYIKGTCVKPRKSEPQKKVGICTLGATVNKGKEICPVVICPQRFKDDFMFETLREKYLSAWRNVKWIQEVNIGVGGNVDYVAVEVDEHDLVKDFLCVEIQAGGTTGTPYPYVVELLNNGRYSGKKHTFGVNWTNEFSKTMMQQAYKKGKIVESWHRKIVFVLQDLAMFYLKSACDCSLLTDYNPNSPVDFCSFKLGWNNPQKKWALSFNKIQSTTIKGIDLMLGGANVNEYPSEEDFIGNIIRKGIADGVLNRNPFTKQYL